MCGLGALSIPLHTLEGMRALQPVLVVRGWRTASPPTSAGQHTNGAQTPHQSALVSRAHAGTPHTSPLHPSIHLLIPLLFFLSFPQARFQYDALRYQRLNVPFVKGAKGLEQSTWREAFAAIADAVRWVGAGKEEHAFRVAAHMFGEGGGVQRGTTAEVGGWVQGRQAGRQGGLGGAAGAAHPSVP